MTGAVECRYRYLGYTTMVGAQMRYCVHVVGRRRGNVTLLHTTW